MIYCTFAGHFTKWLSRLGLIWHPTLNPNTSVVWRGCKQALCDLAGTLKLRWRPHLGLRARALRVYAPKYGQLRLVVTRDRHGNYVSLVSNNLTCDLAVIQAGEVPPAPLRACPPQLRPTA